MRPRFSTPSALLLTTLFLAAPRPAAAQALVTEDFEDQLLPAGWTHHRGGVFPDESCYGFYNPGEGTGYGLTLAACNHPYSQRTAIETVTYDLSACPSAAVTFYLYNYGDDVDTCASSWDFDSPPDGECIGISTDGASYDRLAHLTADQYAIEALHDVTIDISSYVGGSVSFELCEADEYGVPQDGLLFDDFSVVCGETDCEDGADNDGDGLADCADPDCSVDVDGDGTSFCDGDCDDADPDVGRGAEEYCNGIDDDCDGDVDEDDAIDVEDWWPDLDGDGYGNPNIVEQACDPPQDFVGNDDDCDDGDEDQFPGADEYCNNEDDDCDGTVDEDDAVDALTWYADDDGDGFGDPDSTLDACSQPTGYVFNDADCDDTDDQIKPTASEVCDGEDNDCDGEVDEDDAVDATLWYEDGDGDGYGDPTSPTVACDAPTGYVADNTDCDDDDGDVNPGAAEVFDGEDQDCDDLYDEGAFPDDAIVITEIMKDPQQVLDGLGEWFEIHNTTGVDVNLVGLEVSDDGSDSFSVNALLTVAAGDYAVLGKESNPADNGGLTVDYEYGGQMSLANGADEIVLTHGGVELDAVADDATPQKLTFSWGWKAAASAR